MNLPNQITVGRFILAIVFLVVLSSYDWKSHDPQRWLIESAYYIFIIAAVSDFLDGYLARKQNQVTSFGRILDPFVDKALVCGGFILLLGNGFVDQEGRNVCGLSAWMVVIIIARELLVSGLRGDSEARGTPYAANYWGKAKMVTQCITIPLMLKTLSNWGNYPWVVQLRDIMIVLTVIITALSVVAYLMASREALSER
ncbi:MAG TPA: CDP-diacylglycerol--glycerol-3-phosphate 3-phosphatidyltransferase, partial [Phycisphaerae bacterium]|nr:CDP-diacylglycerol--glycerol-3-phosphate 3-phosphatidyltransferase [Phycisphaerae bacterium]